MVPGHSDSCRVSPTEYGSILSGNKCYNGTNMSTSKSKSPAETGPHIRMGYLRNSHLKPENRSKDGHMPPIGNGHRKIAHKYNRSMAENVLWTGGPKRGSG